MFNQKYKVFLVMLVLNGLFWIVPSYANPESSSFELVNHVDDEKSQGLTFEELQHKVTKNLPSTLAKNEKEKFVIIAQEVAPGQFKFGSAYIRAEDAGTGGSAFFSVECKDKKCSAFKVHGYHSNKIAFSWDKSNPTKITFCTEHNEKRVCP